jgi:hypothetical protein
MELASEDYVRCEETQTFTSTAKVREWKLETTSRGTLSVRVRAAGYAVGGNMAFPQFTEVPNLDELANDPARAMELPPGVALALLLRITRLNTALLAAITPAHDPEILSPALLGPAPSNGQSHLRWGDRGAPSGSPPVEARRIADLLGVSRSWLYQNWTGPALRLADGSSVCFKIGGRLMGSEAAAQRLLEERQGRPR